jgi:hypothetical protein
MIRHAFKISDDADSTRKEKRSLHLEKRKCARVSIAVVVSCVSIDSKDRPLDQTNGIVKNVSQAGLKIEAEKDVSSDRLKLAFVDLNKRVAQITGKVVFSRKTSSGAYKIGVQLQGHKPDVVQFVSKLVRFHHYTKKKNALIRSKSKVVEEKNLHALG